MAPPTLETGYGGSIITTSPAEKHALAIIHAVGVGEEAQETGELKLELPDKAQQGTISYEKRSTSTTERQQLIPAHLITDDFDALRFEAAASLQLTGPSSQVEAPGETSSHLISSPYNDSQHLLDLRSLDTQNRLLALALTLMKPTRPDYATAEYLDSFNWDDVLSKLRELAGAEEHAWKEQAFYTVIFRSQLNTGIDPQRLHDLDKNSHREAAVSGGLLKYWFGSKDSEERNLATCIWRSKEDARLGGLGPEHKKARMAARELYHSIRFSTWKFTIEDGAKGLRLESWDEGGHGSGHYHANVHIRTDGK